MNVLALLLNTAGAALGALYNEYLITFLGAIGAIAGFAAAYVFQIQPRKGVGSGNYAVVIETVAGVKRQLSELSEFLDRERVRVEETEAIVRNLGQEKARLEPIVATHRETVDAILAANARYAARSAWKERLYGFALGVLASIVASFVFELLRK